MASDSAQKELRSEFQMLKEMNERLLKQNAILMEKLSKYEDISQMNQDQAETQEQYDDNNESDYNN
jgi:hypothetical protein